MLGVARSNFSSLDLPGDQHDFTFEFLGLIALADPVRATVPDAVRECREAGIRVVMITGDYAETARSIARQAGLDESAAIITGPELNAMDAADAARTDSRHQHFCAGGAGTEAEPGGGAEG